MQKAFCQIVDSGFYGNRLSLLLGRRLLLLLSNFPFAERLHSQVPATRAISDCHLHASPRKAIQRADRPTPESRYDTESCSRIRVWISGGVEGSRRNTSIHPPRRCNAAVEALGDRLAERGKEKMVIIGAAMRKLLHICYGVLKNQSSFDPSLHPGT